MPTKPVILAVDDEPGITEAISDLLEDDFSVLTAPSGAAALAILADRRDVAVILCDQRMPGMSGDAFFKAARRKSRAVRIMITGYADLQAIMRAVNDGQIHAYVEKPFDAGQLLLMAKAAHREFELSIAVQAERELLAALMNSTQDLIAVTDTGGNFISINKALALELGLPAPELAVGRAEHFAASDAQAEELRAIRQEILLQGAATVKRVRCDQDDAGAERWWSNVSVPVRNSAGDIEAIIAIRRDITEDRRMQLEAQSAAAERLANKAKSQFLARMSHELRTPLTAIMGMSDLLLTTDQQEDQREVTTSLRQSAQTLLDLLNDILDLAKIEAGKMSVEPVHFRLSALLVEIERLFAPLAGRKALSLDIECGAETHDVFLGDVKRIRQILANLVGNAIKFTAKGTVSVRRSVTLRQKQQAWVELTVEDTGAGISAEALPRLFGEFEQESASTAGRYGGSGLGLNICKRLLDLMGGSITVESEKGRGTKFVVAMPLPLGKANLITRAAGAGPAANISFDRRLSILSAEDTPLIQFLLTRMLGLWKHEVRAVGNGLEAVSAAQERKWDVILLDMHMPIMDGSEAARMIRQGNGVNAVTPIIALTADAFENSREAYLEAGCNVVVTKPVDWTALARHIEDLVAADSSCK